MALLSVIPVIKLGGFERYRGSQRVTIRDWPIANRCRGDGVVDEDGRDGGGGGEGLGVEDSAAGRGAIQQQRQLFAELFGVGGAGLAGGIGEPRGKGFLVVAGVTRVPGGPGRGFRRPPR